MKPKIIKIVSKLIKPKKKGNRIENHQPSWMYRNE